MCMAFSFLFYFRLEVRTLFVDFDKRKEDIKVMQSMFPNIAFRIIDGIYMKSGCDQERAIAALKQKIEEDNKKKQKDLEEWRKTYGDKHKLSKYIYKVTFLNCFY